MMMFYCLTAELFKGWAIYTLLILKQIFKKYCFLCFISSLNEFTYTYYVQNIMRSCLLSLNQLIQNLSHQLMAIYIYICCHSGRSVQWFATRSKVMIAGFLLWAYHRFQSQSQPVVNEDS